MELFGNKMGEHVVQNDCYRGSLLGEIQCQLSIIAFLSFPSLLKIQLYVYYYLAKKDIKAKFEKYYILLLSKICRM